MLGPSATSAANVSRIATVVPVRLTVPNPGTFQL